MSKNKKNDIIVSFVGGSKTDVTGSCCLVQYRDNDYKPHVFAIEMGLIQGSFDVEKNISLNRRMIENISISTIKELEAVFITHPHADHIGNISICNSENGFNGSIIMSKECILDAQDIIEDSIKIHEKDIQKLKSKGKKVKPLYTKRNMFDCFEHMMYITPHKRYKLNDYISYEYINSGHVIGGCMITFYITRPNGRVFRLTYTGDMGSNNNNKLQHFVPKRDEIPKTDLLISEATYNNKSRSFTYEQAIKEMDFLIDKIKECINNGGNVLLPTFSFARGQELLIRLYERLKDDSIMNDKNVQIVVAGKLIHKINNNYKKILNDEDCEYFNKVLQWQYIKNSNAEESSTNAILTDKEHQHIVLASSGFMVNGVVCAYLQKYLGSPKNYIIATGYCGSEGSIGYQILDDSQRTIIVNGETILKQAKTFQLKCMSSHIQHDELIELFKTVNCKQILIHHSGEGKEELVLEAREEIAKVNKTTKISAVSQCASQFVF